MLLLEPAQVGAQRGCLRPVPHRIKSRIGPDFLESPLIHVALRAEMQLFRPSLFAVQSPKEQHHEGRKLGVFRLAGGLTRANAAEDVLRNRRRAEVYVAVIEGMVRQAAAHLMKIIVTLFERIEKTVQTSHLNVGRGAQTVDPGIESFCIPDSQGSIRPKRGKDADLET